jgi:hypothetical protein
LIPFFRFSPADFFLPKSLVSYASKILKVRIVPERWAGGVCSRVTLIISRIESTINAADINPPRVLFFLNDSHESVTKGVVRLTSYTGFVYIDSSPK